SPAQADQQDRLGPAPHRAGRIRLLRRDRRADRHQAPGSPPDRHPLPRGAGTPRAQGTHDPGRLISPFAAHAFGSNAGSLQPAAMAPARTAKPSAMPAPLAHSESKPSATSVANTAALTMAGVT